MEGQQPRKKRARYIATAEGGKCRGWPVPNMRCDCHNSRRPAFKRIKRDIESDLMYKGRLAHVGRHCWRCGCLWTNASIVPPLIPVDWKIDARDIDKLFDEIVGDLDHADDLPELEGP